MKRTRRTKIAKTESSNLEAVLTKISNICLKFDRTNKFQELNKNNTYAQVYVTVVDNQYIYVGKQVIRPESNKNNANKYVGSGKKIKSYVKENGLDKIEKTVLYASNNIGVINVLEMKILEQILCEKIVWNLIKGSASSNYQTDLDNKKRGENISKAKIGSKRDEATKAKIKNAHLGKMILKNIKTGDLELRPVSDMNKGVWVHKSLGKKYAKKVVK